VLSASLEEAVQRFGEFGDECGPLYYQYGCALLGQAQKESGALGEGLEKKATVKRTGGEGEGETGEGGGSGEQVNGKQTKTEEEENPEGKEKDKEDNDDMKLAWDVLEVARIIYEKKLQGLPSEDSKNKKETQLFLAAIHSRIGDLSMEVENFDAGYEDHKKSLTLKQEVLPEDDRSLAATYSTLAVISLYQTKHLQALEHYKQAQETFRKRLFTFLPKVAATATNGPLSTVTEVVSLVESVEKVLHEYKEAKSFYDELVERVEDLEQVIKKEAEEKSNPPSEEKKNVNQFGQTTIGFGSSSSSGDSAATKTEVTEKIPILSVKRKRDTTAEKTLENGKEKRPKDY